MHDIDQIIDETAKAHNLTRFEILRSKGLGGGMVKGYRTRLFLARSTLALRLSRNMTGEQIGKIMGCGIRQVSRMVCLQRKLNEFEKGIL